MNNFYKDKKGRYEIKPTTIETVDRAVHDYFDKKLGLRVDTDMGIREVSVYYAGSERWAAARKRNFRDEDGTLILPIISIDRVDFDRTPGFGGMAQEVPEITIAKKVHKESSFLQNLVETRRRSGFPREKKETIYEYLTLPFPDFCTVYYEITIWTQYQQHMNAILEKIFYKYDHRDSFVMPVEYDGKEPKGNGYYFVGFRDGNVTPQSNTKDFTDEERILKYGYNIKVPAYFMLDPKEEALSYGDDGKGKKVVHKYQSVTNISYKEEILTAEEFAKKYG